MPDLSPVRVYIGDDWLVPVVLRDTAGNPIDLTGATVGLEFWPSGSMIPLDLTAAGGGLTVTQLNPAKLSLLVPRSVTAHLPAQQTYQGRLPTRAHIYLIDTREIRQTITIIPFQPLSPRYVEVPAPFIGTVVAVLASQGPAGASSVPHSYPVSIAQAGQVVIPLPVPPTLPSSIRLTVNGLNYSSPDFTVNSTILTWANNDFQLEPTDKVVLSYT